jgi:hypothetical protein
MTLTASIMRRTTSLPIAVSLVIALAAAGVALYLLTSAGARTQAPTSGSQITVATPAPEFTHEDSHIPPKIDSWLGHEDSHLPARLDPILAHEDSHLP